jgi:hypothetical protein
MSKNKDDQQKITTIYVTPIGLQRMNKLAQEFGYYQTRGAGAGKIGSISQLVEAIAQGELTLQKPV